MNWFKRHLNWASGLGILLGFILATGGSVKTFLESIFYVSYTGLILSLFSDISSGGVGAISILAIIGMALCIIILVWVLKQKHRTLWWVLIIFVPIGWVFILSLKNHSEVIDMVDGKIITRPRNKDD